MPPRHTRATLIVAIAIVALLWPGLQAQSTDAEVPWNPAFSRTWQRTDKPVADNLVSRTWIWGPQAFTPGLLESYEEATAQQRLVQYYDKSRMEVNTDQSIGAESVWRVTNGLLARELITGQMQTGDNRFESHGAAQVNVAGDLADPSGPTYATMAGLLGIAASADGEVITRRIDRSGLLSADPSLARYNVVAAQRVMIGGIDHQIASPFWSFMQSSGLVYEGGRYSQEPLFQNSFYATGYPLTEAYWSRVLLGGVGTDVLVQCFERRCLTYTPSNPAGWQVETGNIGQHYYAWRYGDTAPIPAPRDSPRIVLDPGHDVTTGGALGTEYQEVMRTALATRAALQAAGYTVLLTRPDNATVLYGVPGLMPGNAATMDPGYNEGYAHTSRALQLEPDLYISLHYNGSASAAARGMTIYYCDYGGAQNEILAGFVRDELLSAFRSIGYEPPYARIAEDGEIGKSYGHLATLGNVYSQPFAFQGNRLVGVPAVLTEPLFMTNSTERALLHNDATHEAFAQAYVRAVDRYFGR